MGNEGRFRTLGLVFQFLRGITPDKTMSKTTSNAEYVEKLKENTDGNIRIVMENPGIWIELENMSNLEIPDVPNWYVEDIEVFEEYIWVFFKYVL